MYKVVWAEKKHKGKTGEGVPIHKTKEAAQEAADWANKNFKNIHHWVEREYDKDMITEEQKDENYGYTKLKP